MQRALIYDIAQLEVSDESKRDQHLTDARKRLHSSQIPQQQRHGHHYQDESSPKRRRHRSLTV